MVAARRGHNVAVRRRRIWLYGTEPLTTSLSWLGDERIAVGGVPTSLSVLELPELSVTHVVNCRSRLQTLLCGDLAVERTLFGRDRVARAAMTDNGGTQAPRRWAPAARFAADVLDNDPGARVLIHCHQGRRRSVLVAYAVLRLRGRSADAASAIILDHRKEAVLVPAYLASVETWLARRREPGRPTRS
jgi:protein-tyrosine phosphatase